MAKTKALEIREGDWLDLRVKVGRTWPDGKLTVEISDISGNARKLTIASDSTAIVGHVKG